MTEARFAARATRNRDAKATRYWSHAATCGRRRFWPFPLIEGGWLLALSLLLIAATIWLVRRRPA